MSTFKEFWSGNNLISQVIFILIILYCFSAISVLLLVLGLLPYIDGMYLNSRVLIGFAMGSFGLSLLISIYHLSTMLRRRKRKDDSN